MGLIQPALQVPKHLMPDLIREESASIKCLTQPSICTYLIPTMTTCLHWVPKNHVQLDIHRQHNFPGTEVTDLSLSCAAIQARETSMTGTSSYLQHQHLSHVESSKAVICDSLLAEVEVLEFVAASFPACLAQTDLYSLGMLSASPHGPTSHLQPLVNQSWAPQECCDLMTNALCGMLGQQHGKSWGCQLCPARMWSRLHLHWPAKLPAPFT